MDRYEVIICGGGPAGSACAWKLKQLGLDPLILDKQKFPRDKVCAGWISPGVIENLKIDISKYPHSITTFRKIYDHIYGLKLVSKTLQYAIRRYEFDHWLLNRAGVKVVEHNIKEIQKDNDTYIIDEKYRCRFLVGAGGTHCPVYQTFFKQANPRDKESLIVALEEEFPYEYNDNRCQLWFFENRLPGYSWYVPKSGGYVNVGIGAWFYLLKKKNENIHSHWNYFIKKLQTKSLLDNRQLRPKGYVYYVRNNLQTCRIDNAFIIGDAAGLATTDMGEGIAPAVQSGILAAESIASGKEFDITSIKRHSNFATALLVRFNNKME